MQEISIELANWIIMKGYDEKQWYVPVGYLVAKIGEAVGVADTDRKWTLIGLSLVDVDLVDVDADALFEGWKVGIPRDIAVLLIGIGIECIRSDNGISSIMAFPIVTMQRNQARNNQIIRTIPITVNPDLLLLFLP